MLRETITENGRVRGVVGTDARITVYKGIPYAAPTCGDNRNSCLEGNSWKYYFQFMRSQIAIHFFLKILKKFLTLFEFDDIII